MAENDFKQHVHSSEDFYALLELESSATEAEIRRAYRQTARKYHPDKVGASNQAALEKFHLLQIAYGILSDDSLKELYDNGRRARQEQEARKSAFSDRRKAMVEELERRESNGRKRKVEEQQAEQRLEQLAADGKRRRLEMQDRLRREQLQADALYQQDQQRKEEQQMGTESQLDELDRGISVRYVKNDKTERWDKAFLETKFAKHGTIEGIILKEKRLKPPGAKHKQDYFVATILYKSIREAHAAILQFPEAQAMDEELKAVESVGWVVARKNDTTTTTKEDTGTAPIKSDESRKIPKFSFNPKLATK
ncbi:hypothetical protein AMS68_000343 [Peltaster fructicola]|uniref:J domain-containing protein n=1 Tax=Peltaster fructicola TaxID=286661 RepID=A0A6H0XJD4_9PEZI|nr:hypothetical protein AMS68_000343 [Peltaster fructicola]